MDDIIIIKGLRQNKLKNISMEIPKNRIVVFTGVSEIGLSCLSLGQSALTHIASGAMPAMWVNVMIINKLNV